MCTTQAGFGNRLAREKKALPGTTRAIESQRKNPPIADRTIVKKCIIKSITAKLVPVGSGMFVYLICSSGNLLFI